VGLLISSCLPGTDGPTSRQRRLRFAEQPYYYDGPHQDARRKNISGGHQGVLLEPDADPYAVWRNGRGLYVATAFDGLRRLR